MKASNRADGIGSAKMMKVSNAWLNGTQGMDEVRMAMLYSEYQTNLVMTIHKRGSKFRAQFKDVGEVHTQFVLDAHAGCTTARPPSCTVGRPGEI